MRRILIGISCICALGIAPAAIAAEVNSQGASVASHAPSPTVAAEEAVRGTGQTAPDVVVTPRGVEIPQGAAGVSARRVDKPEDLGLRGGSYEQIVTIDINDKDVEDVIRLIAAKGKINLLLNPPQVEGTITVHLEDVKLGIALEQILRNSGLGYVREPGNILRIVPAAEVGQADIILEHEVIVLNWVKAKDLQTTLQPFISQQGQVQANDENNSIVVTDTPPNIATIRQLIAELDVPEKQVMIEMHLVDVGEDFSKQHGINWNIFRPDSAGVSPAVRDARRVITDPITGALSESILPNNPVDQMGVAVPITGAFNWDFGKQISIFGQDYLLDGSIQANASQNYAQVLANPRVITLNNLEAKIRIEEQIPYVQATTSTGTGGITTEQIVFQDAGQEVVITPTITANGFVRMQIELNQKIFRGRIGGTALSPPQIDEREAQTTAIVEDGKTIALGGLEGHRLLDGVEGTPWLMNVPVFRWFFQSKNSAVTKSTLYLFVRPKIISVDNSDLSESEKYWFDSVERNWEMPNEFFDNWPAHWGQEKLD